MSLNFSEFFGDLHAVCVLRRYLFVSVTVYLYTLKASVSIVRKGGRALTLGIILVVSVESKS